MIGLIAGQARPPTASRPSASHRLTAQAKDRNHVARAGLLMSRLTATITPSQVPAGRCHRVLLAQAAKSYTSVEERDMGRDRGLGYRLDDRYITASLHHCIAASLHRCITNTPLHLHPLRASIISRGNRRHPELSLHRLRIPSTRTCTRDGGPLTS